MGSCCDKQESADEAFDNPTRPVCNNRRRRRMDNKKGRQKRRREVLDAASASQHYDKKPCWDNSPLRAVNNEDVENYEVNENDYPDLENDLADSECISGESVLCNHRRWAPEDVISSNIYIKPWIAKTVMKLLDDSCTIPFIARYRREVTGGLGPEVLRDIQECYENLKTVQKKADNVAKILKKDNKLDLELTNALSNATTLSEVEYLYAPYKTGSKRTLAERAKQLGLEESALNILNGSATVSMVRPERFVNTQVEELSTLDKVIQGWQHIIASTVSKDKDVLAHVRKLCESRSVTITAKKSTTAVKKDKAAYVEGKNTETFKFENYFEFEVPVGNVKAHQVMALNRGEHLKVLTVKVALPESIKNRMISFCHSHWPRHFNDPQTMQMLEKAFEDSYSRLLEPLICRQTRAQLTKTAEKESISVFTSNLKRLLLTPPIRGHVVCGIDPGFTHGCKLAVLSPSGDILCTDVLYLHGKKASSNSQEADKLRTILQNFRCEKIGVGNGTACRETEFFLSNLIKSNFFKPLNVQYCIVNESGVSIYSVTKEAEAEMPSLDPNVRSAVSLARRLQDPLLEYVKVDPKHIGVGMYQHDVNDKLMKNALNEVMIECVSFVGVDLNVSSEVVLGKIAGLTPARVKSIIEWRRSNGCFKNRQQLLQVKGLGPKAFEQCAGFVKVFPETCQLILRKSPEVGIKAKRRLKKVEVNENFNPLDMTIIHPESYDKAERFLTCAGLKLSDVGTDAAIAKVKDFVLSQGLENLAENLGTPVPTMKLICDALQESLEIDIRSEFEKPLFRQSVTSLEELCLNQVLTGRVVNSTDFGAFVDIGVGRDGLIHTSNMSGCSIALGDHVNVQVIEVDKDKGRVGLKLLLKDGNGIKAPQTPVSSKGSYEKDPKKAKSGCSLDKIIRGTTMKGIVRNVVEYGAFVDIGARRDGLIHKSKMGGKTINKGNTVQVKILNVDIPRERISLELLSIIAE